MRGSIALRTTIATHPRMIAALVATVAGCLALLMTFVWGFVGASTASAATTTYAVKDLGTLGCCSPQVDDINASGQVVGSNFTLTTGNLAFLYEDGQIKDLGVLPDANCSLSFGLGINDSGDVVGESCTSTEEMHIFLYKNKDGEMIDLGAQGNTCGSPSLSGRAMDINASGQVAGWRCASNGDNYAHAFLYSESTGWQDLGTLFGGLESAAHAINDSGQVVGYSSARGANVAFLYSESTGMQSLGVLPGSPAGVNSQAFDINASGQVVGYSGSSAGEHAFLWADDGDPNTVDMKDLGTLGGFHSYAYGINDSGQVVGNSQLSTSCLPCDPHAFLYTDGQMQDLNDLIPADSGWTLTHAREINNSGQIVGSGKVNGATRLFLATPDRDSDGVGDDEDNCPDVANPDQADNDGNGVGAACEEEAVDNIPPKVLSTFPRDGGEVGPAANVRATFSEDMQSASVKNAFKLFRKGSTTQIAAQVSYDAATDIVTLNPNNNLKRGATYKAVVTTVAKDVAGNRLDQDDSRAGLQQKVWFFDID